jgi:eukaryotic-like serine/threonine-protein kinase
MDTTDVLNSALAGAYAIERELGHGGMATVYLAADLKHDRKVAIKVLKPELAAVLGAERFVVEIKTTAALQHPHILPLFDSGVAKGLLYYVMPYIQGETIREKLNRETQFGVDEAVRIAREVADALDYAHRHGVIHRDIKPENILLHDGRAMVMDFGIALAVSAAAGGRMTETGLSLGTPHYMSPEQATAEKSLTARSDIYSLASVLYEMLTGDPPFTASSAQAVIMKIITDVARPAREVRRNVPANVAAALAKALEKLPPDRFDSAKEFAAALADPHFTTDTSPSHAAARSAGFSHILTLGLGAALILMTGVAGWLLLRPKSPPPVIRYALALPDEQAPDPRGFALATSDGSRIIYLGQYRGPSTALAGVTQLWMKRRDALTATPLAGTEGSSTAALSPDDAWLAFVQGAFLRKLPMAGGTPTVIAEHVSNLPGSVAWLDDGSIVYVASNAATLMRIPETGGPGKVIWSSDSLSLLDLTPLPSGRGVLLHACHAPCDRGDVVAIDFGTASARVVIPGATYARYIPTGSLVYVSRERAALVVPFDLRSLTMRGSPVTVTDSVAIAGTSPFLSVSTGGAIVMRRGAGIEQQRYELVWVDRAGRQTAVDSSFTFRLTEYAGNFGWALSPDGTRLAIGLNTESGDDIWIKALPRGPVSRVTSGPRPASRPRWASDGRSVTAVTDAGVILHRADGTGKDSMLWRGNADEGLLSPDGKWLVIRQGARAATSGGRDIFGVRLGVDTELQPLVNSPYDEYAMALSPDGRWLAYESNETGRSDVFVRPFPNTNDGKFPVSIGGGAVPLWSRSGRELFFVRDGTMMAAAVTPGPPIRFGEPHPLFEIRGALAERGTAWYTPWDVAPDGRFIMVRSVHPGRFVDAPLIVMENWLEELKANRSAKRAVP